MKIIILIFSFFCFDLLALPPEKWINDAPDNQYQKQDFFRNWPIQKELRKLFNNEELKLFFEIIPNGPAHIVEKKGNFLTTYICLAHACHAKNYRFFYNIKTKILSVCRFNHIDTNSEDGKWYGPMIESKDKTKYPKDDFRYCDIEV